MVGQANILNRFASVRLEELRGKLSSEESETGVCGRIGRSLDLRMRLHHLTGRFGQILHFIFFKNTGVVYNTHHLENLAKLSSCQPNRFTFVMM